MKLKIIVATILTVYVGQVYACKCNDDNSVAQSFKSTDLIISGTVISTTLIQYSGTIKKERIEGVKSNLKDDKQKLKLFESDYIYEVLFSVTKRYKGTTKVDTVTIYTTMQSGSCGYKFQKDKTYIVYASSKNQFDFMFLSNSDQNTGLEKQNSFWTHICTRTKEYNKLEADELTVLSKKSG